MIVLKATQDKVLWVHCNRSQELLSVGTRLPILANVLIRKTLPSKFNSPPVI
jgi:hypothetical protein